MLGATQAHHADKGELAGDGMGLTPASMVQKTRPRRKTHGLYGIAYRVRWDGEGAALLLGRPSPSDGSSQRPSTSKEHHRPALWSLWPLGSPVRLPGHGGGLSSASSGSARAHHNLGRELDGPGMGPKGRERNVVHDRTAGSHR